MLLECAGHHKINRKRKINCSPLQLTDCLGKTFPTHLRWQKCIQTSTQRGWKSLVTLQKTHLIKRLKSWGSSIGFIWIRFRMNWFCFDITWTLPSSHEPEHKQDSACWNCKPYKEILQAWICWGLSQKETWVICSLWGVNHRLLAVKNTLLLLHACASDNTEILKLYLDLNSKQCLTNKRFPTVSLLETTAREYMQLALKKPTLSSSQPPHQCISNKINTSRLGRMLFIGLPLNLVHCSCGQN